MSEQEALWQPSASHSLFARQDIPDEGLRYANRRGNRPDRLASRVHDANSTLLIPKASGRDFDSATDNLRRGTVKSFGHVSH